MKTNPNCTRPECPKEFPDAQNFCNVCGDKLTIVADVPSKKIGFPSEEAKTFASREFHDVDDVLQLPQEPFDPMKTVISPQGTTFPTFSRAEHHEAEEGIIEIPESGELTALTAHQKSPKPSLPVEEPIKTPVASEQTEVFQVSPIHQEPSKTIVDRPYESPKAVREEETILEPVSYESPTVISGQPETIVEQPKTIFEQPSRPEPSESAFKPYEPPSPFSEQTFAQSKTPLVEEKTPFEKKVSQTPFAGAQGAVETTSPQMQSSFPAQQPEFSFASAQKDQKLAVASLILGILGVFCLGVITGIPAIIMGYMAKNRADSQSQIYGGRGFAIAGIVLGIISILVTILLAFIFIYIYYLTR